MYVQPFHRSNITWKFREYGSNRFLWIRIQNTYPEKSVSESGSSPKSFMFVLFIGATYPENFVKMCLAVSPESGSKIGIRIRIITKTWQVCRWLIPNMSTKFHWNWSCTLCNTAKQKFGLIRVRSGSESSPKSHMFVLAIGATYLESFVKMSPAIFSGSGSKIRIRIRITLKS